MKKEQALGLIRELLMAIGVALIVFGYVAEGTDILPAVGGAMSIVSFAWSLAAHEGLDAVVSLFRKALSAVGGGLVAYGVANPEHVEAITAIILPVVSAFSSWKSNSDSRETPYLPMMIIGFAVCAFFQSGCAFEVRPDGTRTGYITPDIIPVILGDK